MFYELAEEDKVKEKRTNWRKETQVGGEDFQSVKAEFWEKAEQ